MKRIALCAALLLALTSNAHAALITAGSITASAGGGLHATDGWSTSATVLSWTVDRTGNLYTYNYSFSVPTGDVGSVVLQVGNSFTAADVGRGSTAGWALNRYPVVQGGVPGSQAAIKGLTWDASGRSASWRVVTDRAPMAGSFFARDGSDNALYAYSGTLIDNSSPVPDKIPIPPAFLLLGSGLAGLGALNRRLRFSKER